MFDLKNRESQVDDWGWLIWCDAFADYGRSIFKIIKVSGEKGRFRKVVTHKVRDQKSDFNTSNFANLIIAEVASGEYPNMTIVIGRDCIESCIAESLFIKVLLSELERQGLGDTPVQIINWEGRVISPLDRTDTHCFMHLIDYIPHNQ